MSIRKPSIPWARLSLEMVAIVFSVLLALVLDDWRQNRQQDAILEAIMLSLRVELERNQRVLEATLPHHEAMRDTFAARASAVEPTGRPQGPRTIANVAALRELGFEDGIQIVESQSTSAWEAARASGVLSRVGTEQLYLLSSAYETQEDVDRSLQRLLVKYDQYVLAVIEGERPAFATVAFATALSDVVQREQSLCTTYQTLARRLSGGPADPEGRCGSGHVTIR